MIPTTKRKLREAKFYCGCMNEEKSNPSDHEKFLFYLSAYLAASRSVRDFLRAEFLCSAQNKAQKKKRRDWYKDWLPKWEDGLDPDDKRDWEFADDQRQVEIHEQGAKTHPIFKYISILEIPPDNPEHPAYGHQYFAPTGTPPPTVKQTVYVFKRDANKEEEVEEEVIEVCERILALCERMVTDFEEDATSADI